MKMSMKVVKISKTIELRKDINSLLKQSNKKVFYRIAQDDAKFPYIVFNLRDVADSKILELDYWDQGNDTIKIETLVDSVEVILKDTTIFNENHFCAFYYNEDRQFIDDTDKSILRINESFTLNYFGKE